MEPEIYLLGHAFNLRQRLALRLSIRQAGSIEHGQYKLPRESDVKMQQQPRATHGAMRVVR
jgi:hypothetical protein